MFAKRYRVGLFVFGVFVSCVAVVGCPPVAREAGDEETIMLPGNVPLVMVWMPAGSFMMGQYPGEQDGQAGETPQHEVTFASGFWMAKYELTKGQWFAVMGTTPWAGQAGVLDDADSPAVCVTFAQIESFITALNAATNKTFRLPSDAEWEYACRAGTTTRFYWGDDPTYSQMGDYAWWDENADSAGESYAHVVGQKLPNAWGLYDMSGNVWEICQDYWHGDYTGAPTDGSAWMDDPEYTDRVVRNAGWADVTESLLRSAWRDRYNVIHGYNDFGFRLAR